MIDKKQLIEELLECVKDATATETQITGLSICASLMNEVLDEALTITDASQQRELLEWLSNEDYFNIPKDEISEILEDWETYNSNCG